MPLGRLGACSSELLEARAHLTGQQMALCAALAARPRPPLGAGPHILPPRNSTRWQPVGNLTIPDFGTDPDDYGIDLEVPLQPAPRIPDGYDGVLIAFTCMWNGTGFVEGSGDITWRVKQDRRYIPYLDTILESRGSLAVPFTIEGQGVAMLSGQTFRFFANFAAGSEARLNAGGKVICALSGYIWPRSAGY